MAKAINIGVVGCGYWGPNLLRNFRSLPDCSLKLMCDVDVQRLDHLRGLYPEVQGHTDYAHMLNGAGMDAIVIKVGHRCKISSHTFICEGVTLEDEVFIGHNVTFINDRYPRATNEDARLQTEADWKCIGTLIKRGASIGSGATVLCGITVGEYAIVGAGSVVPKNVPARAIVAGNPARVMKSVPRIPGARPMTNDR